MKKSTEQVLIVGILLTGAIALFSKAAGAAESVPAAFHPELTNPRERAFVFNEARTLTAQQMVAKAATYEASGLSAAAQQALAAEAVKKMLPQQIAEHAP